MKAKIYTAISTLMLFIPWTIFPLRTFGWALESPAAEIIIYSYAVFMFLSGVFTPWAYTKGGAKSKWMQVCTVVNCVYAAGALAIAVMIAVSNFS